MYRRIVSSILSRADDGLTRVEEAGRESLKIKVDRSG